MAELPEKSHYRYVLGPATDVKVVRMTLGDHKFLKYYAKKEKKSIGQMLHELFLLGLKCKMESCCPDAPNGYRRVVFQRHNPKNGN